MKGPIVITGAAGFIGRNVVAELNRRGREDLILVDRLGRDERWSNLLGLRFLDFVDADRFRKLVAERSAPPAGTVIHLGACSSTTERDAGYLLDNNYAYTRELCAWALDAGARFVYASSAATFGDGSFGFNDEDAVTLKLRPLNMYGYSKHLFDLWALRTGAISRIAGLKYFNVFGPGEDHKGDMRSVVDKAFWRIAAGQDVELFRSYRPEYPDGGQLRDFVYVQDAVQVTLHFADPSSCSGLYNCGTGRARSWLDLAKALFAALGSPPRIRIVDMPECLRAKYQYFTQADTTKLRRAGYDKPFMELEAAIAEYARYRATSGETVFGSDAVDGAHLKLAASNARAL